MICENAMRECYDKYGIVMMIRRNVISMCLSIQGWAIKFYKILLITGTDLVLDEFDILFNVY